MSDRESADRDPFQIWLDSSRQFLAAEALGEDLRQKCEGLFSAWARFASAYAEASGGAVSEGLHDASGGPFDPIGWIDAAGGGGFGDLWRWFGGAVATGGQGGGASPWQAERDELTGSRQWLAYVAALDRYRSVLGSGWLRAFRRFAEEAPEARCDAMRNTEGSAADWEAMRSRWQAAADAEMAATQSSDEFLDAQRDLIRARLDVSAVLRQRVDSMAGLLGLPTRDEIDELHEAVHELRRQVRRLVGPGGAAE